MIDLFPKQYGTYDCYLNNIIGPVSEYWNICYLPVLWAEFNFINITEYAGPFADLSVGVGSRNTRTRIWWEYCGILIENCKYDTFDMFEEIISIMLQNKTPVGITIDSNYIPWNESGQIRPHCFLICGLDKHDGTLLCCDGTFHPKDICKINSRYVFDHYHELLLFRRIDVSYKDLATSLRYFYSILITNNPRKSEALKAFAGNIAKCGSMGIGDTAVNISQSDFLLDLTEVCNSRHNFMKGVQFFYQAFHTNKFISLVSDLDDLQHCWYAFKGLYIKSVLAGQKSYIDSAVHMILDIERREGEIMRKLLSQCNV